MTLLIVLLAIIAYLFIGCVIIEIINCIFDIDDDDDDGDVALILTWPIWLVILFMFALSSVLSNLCKKLCRFFRKSEEEAVDNSIDIELNNFKAWIDKEAIKRYPCDMHGKNAFKQGIYALLDKIGFEYEKEE